jgi:hypothetical protein
VSADARTVVCRYCSAQLDLTSKDYFFLETLRKQPLDSPLQVGLEGVVDRVSYQIAGVIAWKDGDTKWEDYFLAGPAGRTAWIRYDHFTYQLFQIFKPLGAEPIDLKTVDPESQFVDFGGGHYIVLDRQRAQVSYLEGELPWRVRIGEELVMLRCDPALSVEVSPTEVRYFRWSVVPWQNLADAFKVPDEIARPDPGPMDLKGGLGLSVPASQLLAGGALAMLYVGIMAMFMLQSCPPPRPEGAAGVTEARRHLGLKDAPLRPVAP